MVEEGIFFDPEVLARGMAATINTLGITPDNINSPECMLKVKEFYLKTAASMLTTDKEGTAFEFLAMATCGLLLANYLNPDLHMFGVAEKNDLPDNDKVTWQ